MDSLIYLVVAILGAVVGSFLNVVILRHQSKKSIWRGRSVCAVTGRNLRWFEIIPVLSFCFLGGKARGTNKRLSWQYPLVEAVTAILFVLIAWEILGTHGLLGADLVSVVFTLIPLFIIASLFIVIFVYDLYHKIIPDVWSYSLAGITFVMLFIDFNTLSLSLPSLTHFLAGPILALPFALLWFISKGCWIGLGDAKLSLGIGWFLGLVYGLSAIVLGFWIGALIAILIIIISKITGNKGLTLKSELPLGPFLIEGVMFVYFFPVDIMGLQPFLS